MKQLEIKSLQYCDFEIIFDCFKECFSNYFVPLSFDAVFWENRFKAAGVDYSLSFGIYDDSKLVAFIINCIGKRNGQLCAYNTGTGVLPDYRGNNLIQKIYKYAFSILKEGGVQKCLLEVITDNTTAICTYEKAGFNKTRLYKCFKGELSNFAKINVSITELPLTKLNSINESFHRFYSWDNTNQVLLNSGDTFKLFKVTDELQKDIGFFVINPLTGYLAQFEIYSTVAEKYKELFSAISRITNSVSIKNVHNDRTAVINFLNSIGLENYISQYEMEVVCGIF